MAAAVPGGARFPPRGVRELALAGAVGANGVQVPVVLLVRDACEDKPLAVPLQSGRLSVCGLLVSRCWSLPSASAT